MEVYEKIDKILKEQNISKREFAIRLRNLEPRLKTTGEAPSEKTIYGYLAGRISIAIELIPYISDALGIEEQILFNDTKNSRERFFNNFLQTATNKEIKILKEKFNLQEDCISNIKKSYLKLSKEELDSQVELISLLPYAPKVLQDKIIKKLKNMKKFTDLV